MTTTEFVHVVPALLILAAPLAAVIIWVKLKR
jgi:hypothetical protein